MNFTFLLYFWPYIWK